MVTFEDVKKLKVQELRDELAARGLDKSGNKPALVERLENAVKLDKEGQQDASISKAEAVVESAPASDKAIAPAAKHEPIQAPAKPTAAATNEKTEVEADKLKARAERFGIVSDEEKKRKRLERFGPQKPEGAISAATPDSNKKLATAGIVKAPLSEAEKAAEEQKKKDRAARFGLTVTETKEERLTKLQERAKRFGISNPEVEAAKFAARAERFGIAKQETKADTASVKEARAKRFAEPIGGGASSEEAKRAARAARFATSATAS